MKSSIFTIILIILCKLATPQSESIGDDENFTYPNLIPPSPTAYELGKYGNVPVGLFTGTPNIQIPIYTYKTKNLSLPISLSYSSNGIKVDQLTSNVGLDWNLNIGGVISRVVRDLDDFEDRLYYPEEVLSGNMVSPMAMQFFDVAQEQTIDTEPDLYMFNFNGFSGSFVFDSDKKIVMLPKKPFKIEMICKGMVCGFKITTPDGIEFFFLERELTGSRTYGNGTHTIPTFTESAWYLSEIVHFLGDTIFLDYTGQNYHYTSGTSESIKVPVVGPIVSPSISSSYQAISLSGLKISHISSNSSVNGDVSVSYTMNHPSINGYTLVSDIFIKDESNNVIEKCEFDYLATNNDRVFLKNLTFLDQSKNYEFEYINPSNFPERLSFGQDHWGYYNGHNANSTLVPKPEGYYQFNQFNNPADREPNFIFAKTGLLNKITYPTKGSTIFYHEQNNYYGEKVIFHNPLVVDLETTSYEQYGQTYIKDTIRNIPFNQTLKIKHCNVAYIDSLEIGCPPEERDLDLRAYLEIRDDSEDLLTIFSCENPYIQTNSLLILPGMSLDEYCVAVEKDENYELKLYVIQPCTWAHVDYEYYDQLPDTIQTNIEVGGARIRKTIDYDPITEKNDTTVYYYGSMDDYETSSGNIGRPPIYLSVIDQYTPTAIQCDYNIEEFLLVSSSSLNSLFNSGSSNICYEYVSISNGGDNFRNGAVEHQFIINRDIPGNNIKGNNILSAPLTNSGWNNGLEQKVSYFRKDGNEGFTLQSTTQNNYYLDNRGYDDVFGYSIRKRYDKNCVPVSICTCDENNINDYRTYLKCTANHSHSWLIFGNEAHCIASGANNVFDTIFHPCFGRDIGDIITFPMAFDNLDIIEYKSNSYWHYLNNTITNTYDQNGQNPVTTTTKFYYENDKHLQLTRTSTIDSKGDSLISIIWYPDDVTSTNVLPGGNLAPNEYEAICMLKRDSLFRIAEPVQTETYRNTQLLKRNRTKYKEWQSVVMPEYVQQANADNPLEDRIVYHQYDTHGNPVELSKVDGMHITYLWGYEYSKVLAEIKNATYQQVIDSLDVSYPELQSKTNSELRTIFNNLRNSLDNTMITSLTYDPLVGMTSQTDPNGNVTWYEYDSFGRLKTVKDKGDNVIKHIEYKFLEP